MIIVRVLERFKTASIAELSCIVKWNPYTDWFSSGCSERPRRAPRWRNKLRPQKKKRKYRYQWWQHQQKDDPTPNVLQCWRYSSHADRLCYAKQTKVTETIPMSPMLSQSCRDTTDWKRSKSRFDKSKNRNVHLPLRRREIACIWIGFRSSQPLVSQKATALEA